MVHSAIPSAALPWRHRSTPARAEPIPVRDPRLAELLGRLAAHWSELDAPERERLSAGIAAILELSDASKRRR